MHSLVNVSVFTIDRSCFCDVASTGPAVHTGGKPHALHQGGDAHQRPSRAGVPAPVRPEEEKRVGPAL